MTSSIRSALNYLTRWFSLIKFSHSVFALPFALGCGVVALDRAPFSARQWLWIVVAIVSARTAAMTFNRLVDASIDLKNPRTRDREIPAGSISSRAAAMTVVGAGLVFILASAALGKHCLTLSPLVLAWLLLYSYAKRWTLLAHIILGVALALAPGGAWYAITAELAWLPVLLMVAVALWVSGFDILYSCQDAEFDAREGLFSVPAHWGLRRALQAARVLHFGAALMLFAFGWAASLGPVYYLGILIFSYLLWSQHRLVSPSDLSRVNAAFFTRNGLASMVFLVSVIVDRLMAAVP